MIENDFPEFEVYMTNNLDFLIKLNIVEMKMEKGGTIEKSFFIG